MSLCINNRYLAGEGESFRSINPFSEQVLWSGEAASDDQLTEAVDAAREAFISWRLTPQEERESLILRYADVLKEHQSEFAELITKETGKPLWESQGEITAMIGKIDISLKAYVARTGHVSHKVAGGEVVLRHQPLGVFVVFGPYNFPGHLPNGHIVPALLAGNTVVFKPSEYTPIIGEKMMDFWIEAGLPRGVLNLVHGNRFQGQSLSLNPNIAGILFTGSAAAGKSLHRQFAGQTDKMLALEMGGNNPLVISEHLGDLDAAVYQIIQSAFITSGQRCTCARRLYIPSGKLGEQLLKRLVSVSQRLMVGDPLHEKQPFMGTMISSTAAELILNVEQNLLRQGARSMLASKRLSRAQISPSILDVTSLKHLADEEFFGPLLQVIRYQDFEQAIEMANATQFGLSAGLISTDDTEWQHFVQHSEAGIINRNQALTGASSELPFGGVGASGNYRPSAFYAADFCAYPVASLELDEVSLPEELRPGVRFS